MNPDIKALGIKVKMIGAVESSVDRYGKTHTVVLYKYKNAILGWPTTGTKMYFEPTIGRTLNITFAELSDEFVNKIALDNKVHRISYVKVL